MSSANNARTSHAVSQSMTDSNLPSRKQHWELTFWKKVKLDTRGFDAYFDIVPEQTIKSDHCFFWRIVEVVRASDCSYKLLRVLSESEERRG